MACLRKAVDGTSLLSEHSAACILTSDCSQTVFDTSLIMGFYIFINCVLWSLHGGVKGSGHLHIPASDLTFGGFLIFVVIQEIKKPREY